MPLTRTANGNVSPSRIVKSDPTAEGRVVQAGAGERAYGIAAPWTRQLPAASGPLVGLDDGYAAVADENVTVYVDGDKDVPLELGGTVTYGDRLKADASGKGVTASTDKDQYVAVAKASGVSGEVIPVDVQVGEASV